MSIISMARLPADVAVTTTAFAGIPGLAVDVPAGQSCWFEFFILYSAALATTGSRWAVTGPPGAALGYTADWPSGVATRGMANANAADQGTASTASMATTGNLALIKGLAIVAGTPGLITPRFATEIAASAITAKAGSLVRYGIV